MFVQLIAASAAASAATKTHREHGEFMTSLLTKNTRRTKCLSYKFLSRQHVAQTIPSYQVSTQLRFCATLLMLSDSLSVVSSLCVTDIDFIIDYLCVS